jgi:hypothetical protein
VKLSDPAAGITHKPGDPEQQSRHETKSGSCSRLTVIRIQEKLLHRGRISGSIDNRGERERATRQECGSRWNFNGVGKAMEMCVRTCSGRRAVGVFVFGIAAFSSE